MIHVVVNDLAVAVLNDTEKPALFNYVKDKVEFYAKQNLYKTSTRTDDELQIRNVYIIGSLSVNDMKSFIKYLTQKINQKHLTWVRLKFEDYSK